MSELCFPLPLRVRGMTENPNSHLHLELSIETEIPVGWHPGAFGYHGPLRPQHRHKGVDLYCAPGTLVHAMEDGEVMRITESEEDADPCRNGVSIVVKSPHRIWVYGNLQCLPGMEPGAVVRKGEAIGRVAPTPHGVAPAPIALHLECYHPDASAPSAPWEEMEEKPSALCDPTPLLLEAAGLSGEGIRRAIYPVSITVKRQNRLYSDIDLASSDGTVRYGILKKPAVRILAINEKGNIILVREFRHIIGRHVIALPAGIMDREDETPIEAAIRELREETGFAPEQIEPLFLHPLFSSPGFTNEQSYFFLAQGVKWNPAAPDPEEAIQVLEVPSTEILRFVHENREFVCLGSVAAIFMAARRLGW